LVPSAVLPPGYPPSGGGTTAFTPSVRVKQMSKAKRTRERVFVFIQRILPLLHSTKQ
jgi:hypothetical protein